MDNYSKLLKVPANSRQELLVYIAGQKPAAVISVVTQSGQTYAGQVVNIGMTRDEGPVLSLRLVDSRKVLTKQVLHIAVGYIESILLDELTDAIDILSLGRVDANKVYEVSGKLEVQRAFKALADELATHGIVVSGPEMTLPTDGQSLNRTLKLTGIIRDVLIDVLKEDDARSSWKDRYTGIVFADGAYLSLTGKDRVLTIVFPFSDIQATEINPVEFKERLYSVL